MSSAEEIIAAQPNANGLEKSPEHASSEKVENKTSVMNDGEKIESKNVEEKIVGDKQPAIENHDSLSAADVEMKELKEKTPEPDNQTAAKKSPDKPTTDDKGVKSKDDVVDKSGEEKMECVMIKPLTEKTSPVKESEVSEKMEADKDEAEGGEEDEKDEEEEEEEQETGSSPKKRKPARRAAGSSRKRSQKKSPKKKAEKVVKSNEKASKDTEKTPEKASKDAEKTPEKVSKDDEKEPSASVESPKKSNQSPRKRQKTPEQDEKTPDTSPKSSKDADKTPLLEAPLIIEGKRNRQRVERLDTQMLTPTLKSVDVPHGKGVKLGEIGFIEAMISKTQTNDLKGLHKIIYGRPGTPNEIKKNLRNFCGLDYAEDSKDYEKKKKSLDNYITADLKKMCEVLGLERGGRKEELVEHVLKFLVEPKDEGKKTPQPAAKRKRSAAGSSRKRSEGKGRSRKSATSKKTGKDSAAESGEEDEDAEEHEAEAEPEKNEEDNDKEEEDEPKPKKTKKEKATTSAAASASPSKRGQPKRAAKNVKKPAFPSDAEIKTTIKDLLKGMNLEEVTMKEMTKKVYDKYPDADITSKKDFIKDTVKTLLSSTD